jgi:formamidopyrimidine-DNA glycosylase
MPELPDVEVYREALAARVIGQPLQAVHVRNPFVLRTAVPPLDAVVGQTVRDVLRVGKRIVLAFDAGGLDVMGAKEPAFRERLVRENHTLKRALTDPRLFSGIGNAYSDEILHRARLSPLMLSQKLDDAQVARLFAATREVLGEWTARLRSEAAGEFPQRVTAFRPQMAVHGRFGQPCPVCGAPVQRIVYAENESNYCARCQTGGVILADRALSRLLHKSFPRTLDDG